MLCYIIETHIHTGITELLIFDRKRIMEDKMDEIRDIAKAYYKNLQNCRGKRHMVISSHGTQTEIRKSISKSTALSLIRKG